MDPNQFDALMQSLPTAQEQPQGAPPQQPQEQDPFGLNKIGDFIGRVATEASQTDEQRAAKEAQWRAEHPAPTNPDGTPKSTLQNIGDTYKQSLDSAMEPVEAASGGALKSVFETKDFLFGDTPRDQQSGFRRDIEQNVEELSQKSLFNGFAASIGQFTAGMIGIGKLGQAAKMLPWVGRAVGAIAEAAPVSTEVAKAATVGAIAFDPHDARISNYIQDTPLANPVNAFLASKPDDSAALGRAKAAIESVGLDMTLGAAFLAAGKIFRALNHGDTAAAQAEASAYEAHQRAELAKEQGANAGLDATAGGPGAEASVQPPAGNTEPVGAGQVPPAAEAGNGPVDASGGPGGPAPAGDQGGVPASHDAGNPMGLPEVPPGDAAPSGPGGLPPQGDPVATGVDTQGGKYSAANENPGGARVATPEDPMANGPQIPKGGPVKPAITFSVEDTAAVLKLAQKDADAMWLHDGYYGAILSGHEFGKGEHIPYGKLNTDQDLENFMTRVIDHAQESADAFGGGITLSDPKVQRLVDQTVRLYAKDPNVILGQLQQLGRLGKKQLVTMATSYTLMQKAMADAALLAEKFHLGDSSAFGGDVAAHAQEIRKQLSIAASLYGVGDSLSSNAGRTLRGMRRDVLPFNWKKYKVLSGELGAVADEKLVELLRSTKGQAQALKVLTTPGIWKSMGDFLMFMRVNNLVSSPISAAINITTSGFQLGVRPLQRIMAGAILAPIHGKASLGIMGQALRQYTYMGSALVDGFKTAGKAFMLNDSILSPHNTRMWDANNVEIAHRAPGSQAFGSGYFRPWNNTGNIIYNALSVAGAPLSLPVRGLGAADELVKQITYRSKLAAKAHSDALEAIVGKQGMSAAEKEAFISKAVNDRVENGFSPEGSGLDPEALREANIATFQQDLGEGTFGRGVRALTQQFPAARWVIPFVKTPTNVIREGMKLTPGLNFVQKEYRDMILGRQGLEAQHQAVGQMAMGSLFLGSAAYLVSQGTITGGGPTDPKQRAELLATGWRPYSFVHVNGDGTRSYYSFQRYDPVAIPMGIAADLMDHWHNIEWDGTEESLEPAAVEALTGLMLAVGKQFQQKSYLQGATQALDVLMGTSGQSGDSAARRLADYFGQQAQGFVPYSSAARLWNQTDDAYMRDARSLTDKLMQVTPGQSATLQPRRNWLGEKMTNRPGLWSTDDAAAVDTEMQRLVLQNGTGFTRASPYVKGVDLRNVTLEDGTNAYERYQALTEQPKSGGKTLRARMFKLMTSKGYQKAPDGAADIAHTKMNLIAHLINEQRKTALKIMQRDKNFRTATQLPQQQANDQFRAVRGLPPKAPTPLKGGAAVEGMMDAFGIGDDDTQE